MTKLLTWLATLGFSLAAFAETSSLSPERQAALKLQLFLDEQGFSPGPIDGKFGTFTQKAVERWQKAGKEPSLNLKSDAPLSLEQLPDKVTSGRGLKSYTITEEDLTHVGTVPSSPEEQAKQDHLPYSTALEALAEKFHAYPSLLEELNPEADFSSGSKIMVPDVAQPFEMTKAKDLAEEKASDQDSNLSLKVLREDEIVEVYQDGTLVHSFPTTVGEAGNTTPSGKFTVDVVQWMPEFRYDDQMLEEGKRSSDAHMLPPGPNSPVGIVWIGLSTDGIGLHGTSSPDTIGRSKSHGCIRLTNWDALTLGQKITTGTEVEVQ